MNLLFTTTRSCRLSTHNIFLLSRPQQQQPIGIMRQLTSPTRSIHTHTHIPHGSRRNNKPLAVALGLGSIPFLTPSRTTFNDTFGTGPDISGFSSSAGSSGAKKNVPVMKGGKLNPDAIKQISFGGILGLGLGVLFSMLSRMLVLLLGVGVVVWQYAARKGYNIIPAERLQRYVKGIDVRSAIHDNVAFKISFGLMFALTAFGEF